MARPPRFGETFARARQRRESGGGGFSSIGGQEQIVTPSGKVVKVLSGGGGTSRVTSGVPASFISPAARQQEQIRQRVQSLNTRGAKLENKVQAFNRAQAAINAGRPITPGDAAILGIGSFSQRAGTGGQVKLNQIRGNLQKQQSSLSSDISGVNTAIAAPTEAEQAARASLIDRGVGAQQRIVTTRRIASKVGAGGVSLVSGDVGVVKVTPSPIISPLPDRSEFGLSDRPGTGFIGSDFLVSSGEAVFGRQPSFALGKIKPTAPGGAISRSSKVFKETVKGSREFGTQAFGKAGGAFFTGAVGVPLGLATGTGEAVFGTTGLAFGETTRRATGSKTAGELTRIGVEAIGLFEGGISGVRKGTKGAKQIAGVFAEGVPTVLERTSRLLSGSRSVFAPSTRLERLAGVSRGFLTGTKLAKEAPAFTRAERAGKALATGFKRIKGVPGVGIGSGIALGAGAGLIGPSVGEAIATPGVTKEAQEFIKTSTGQAALLSQAEAKQELASVRGARLPEFTFGTTGFGGTTAQIGQDVGLGFLGEKAPAFGGLTAKERRVIAKEALARQGITGARAERLAPEIAKIGRARQFGGFIGQLGISTATELAGAKLVGGTLTRELSGKAAGKAATKTFRTAFKAAGKTIPTFAGLGGTEGFVSVSTTELAQRRAKTPFDLPKRVAEDPIRFLIAGAAGGISAPALGFPIVGFGAERALKAGKSPASRALGEGLLFGGRIVDPLEFPGDISAEFFGKVEPSFRLRRVKGQRIRGRVSTPQLFNVLEPTTQTGVPSVSQQIGAFTGTPVGTPSQTPQTVITPISEPQPITTPSITDVTTPVDTPIDTPIPELTEINQEFQTNIETDITTPVPTPISIPIATPVARAGLPALFPAIPFGGNGRKRGKGKGRRTFFNEYAFASAILGSSLRRSAKNFNARLGTRKRSRSRKKRRRRR